MTPFLRTLLLSFLLCEVACLLALQLGARLARRSSRLQSLGHRAYERKLRSMRTVWPLTRLPEAIRQGDLTRAMAILTPLILLKSAVVLPLGVVALPWLPFASLLVPAIAGAHAPGVADGVHRWVLGVSRLQVTSHVAAASIGFSLTLHGPVAGRALGPLLASHPLPMAVLLLVSLTAGVAAGRQEARGVVLDGVLGEEVVRGLSV